MQKKELEAEKEKEEGVATLEEKIADLQSSLKSERKHLKQLTEENRGLQQQIRQVIATSLLRRCFLTFDTTIIVLDGTRECRLESRILPYTDRSPESAIVGIVSDEYGCD